MHVMRGLLSALWSFLQHPVSVVGDQLTSFEERLSALEGRLVGDLQARLETVRNRVVEDLKHELRRVVLVLALVMACGLLALLAMTFGLMAAWMSLTGLIGAIGASLVLAASFLLSGLIVFWLLHSMIHHPEPPASRSNPEAR
jgi:hypothetical protein